MADFPAPTEGMALTHFIVSHDVERSRRFYTEVIGGEAVLSTPEFSIVALANSWVTIGLGGGPTDDKPGVTLEAPADHNRVSGFLTIRVADIAALYEEWASRGAEFLTPPIDRGVEIRCYMRDPDGHLIEVGQLVSPPGASRRHRYAIKAGCQTPRQPRSWPTRHGRSNQPHLPLAHRPRPAGPPSRSVARLP